VRLDSHVGAGPARDPASVPTLLLQGEIGTGKSLVARARLALGGLERRAGRVEEARWHLAIATRKRAEARAG